MMFHFYDLINESFLFKKKGGGRGKRKLSDNDILCYVLCPSFKLPLPYLTVKKEKRKEKGIEEGCLVSTTTTTTKRRGEKKD